MAKSLNHARRLVESVIADLADYGQFFVAGSIRREMTSVKDGEIVALCTPEQERNLLARLDGLVLAGKVSKANYSDTSTPSYRWGNKYRGLQVGSRENGMKVEIFLATPDNFGYIYWLRTGPGDANMELMTRLSYLHAPVRFEDGKAWWVTYEGSALSKKCQLRVPDEDALFGMLNMRYVPPKDRTEGMYTAFKRCADAGYLERFAMSPEMPTTQKRLL